MRYLRELGVHTYGVPEGWERVCFGLCGDGPVQDVRSYDTVEGKDLQRRWNKRFHQYV